MIKYKYYFLVALTAVFIGYFINEKTNQGPSGINVFEPDLYFASALQVGGIGSDIVSKKAYFIGDGTAYQEGWPNYLSDDYALVSFNTPFYIMYLLCKDGYKATILPDETSDKEPIYITEGGYGIMLEDEIKNTIALKCEKK